MSTEDVLDTQFKKGVQPSRLKSTPDEGTLPVEAQPVSKNTVTIVISRMALDCSGFQQAYQQDRNAQACGDAEDNDAISCGYLVILASALAIEFVSVGRTTRSISSPSRRKIKVGQSLTLKARPRGRPLPSSIF